MEIERNEDVFFVCLSFVCFVKLKNNVECYVEVSLSRVKKLTFFTGHFGK